MRTTISIQDSLLIRAKKLSQERNCTLGEVIEDALRVTLAERSTGKQRNRPQPLKTFRGSGLQPGVDLSASSALLDLMEER